MIRTFDAEYIFNKLGLDEQDSHRPFDRLALFLELLGFEVDRMSFEEEEQENFFRHILGNNRGTMQGCEIFGLRRASRHNILCLVYLYKGSLRISREGRDCFGGVLTLQSLIDFLED